MSTLGPLEPMFAAARREEAPPIDVVSRVLARLPAQPTAVVPDVELTEWIGAGASTVVAACCLWLLMPWWNVSWATTICGWHPLAAMLQQFQ